MAVTSPTTYYWCSPKTPQVANPHGHTPKPPTPTPTGASPKLPLASEIATMEEGKSSTSEDLGACESDSPTISHKVLAELTGTFILIFVGCGSVAIDHTEKLKLTPVGISVTWGLVVMVVIYTLGHVSGAHVNPAVTIALAASKRFPFKHVPAYIGAQTVGSTVASFILKALLGGKAIRATVTVPSDGTSDLQVIVWEIIISFILMVVVCGVATDGRAINELTGVAVGGAILFNVLIAGQVTGASMNPARSIGPAIAVAQFGSLWMYIIAPVIGTLVGTVFYSLLRLPNSPNRQMVKKV